MDRYGRKAWLETLRDDLRANLPFEVLTNPEHDIRIMPDERPVATAGQIFISIFYMRTILRPQESAHYEANHQIGVCITQRVRKTPHDREGEAILIRENCLGDIADEVATLGSNLSRLVSLQNRLDTGWAAEEPLFVESITGPSERFKTWYRSDDPIDDDRTPAGLSMTVVLSGGLVSGPQCP